VENGAVVIGAASSSGLHRKLLKFNRNPDRGPESVSTLPGPKSKHVAERSGCGTRHAGGPDRENGRTLADSNRPCQSPSRILDKTLVQCIALLEITTQIFAEISAEIFAATPPPAS
jgi:hypothetical protein